MGICKKALLIFLLPLFVFSSLQSPAFAAEKSYVVYLGGHPHVGREATSEDFERATKSHYKLLESYLGSEEKVKDAIFYSYTKHINGFAAVLKEEEALQISEHPGVISVIENNPLGLHTTRSWEFLGLEENGRVSDSSIWAKANYGNDTIIGSLDTGVWPESESFSDKGIGPIPMRWRGMCDNNTKAGVPCNRKLIGARSFNLGLMAETGRGSIRQSGSARDLEGHGTHTLSTAAGSPVSGASIFGYANGTAKGGSPAARAAMYKVCWNEGCYPADILAGFDAAIHDGVDVLSVSLGGNGDDYLADPIALGAFHAVAQGIVVVCSAGNSGPTEGTVANTAPWIITVGASTLDRKFPSYLILGNKKRIQGESASSKNLPPNKFYPLANAKDVKAAHATIYEAKMCYYASLDSKKAKGKIVICLRGDNSRMEKGMAVIMAGGVGMVLVNDDISGNSLIADPQLLPSTNIGFNDSRALRSYLNSTKSPMGSISVPMTTYGVKPTPVMADFSSRGPNLISPQIIKPDVTAPGVGILAAFTNATSPTDSMYDTRRVAFNLLSGTSMSCPHVSGVSGLLKTLHPDWSPSAIRSAIMTTARTRDNTGSPIEDSTMTKATPFAYGSGHVRPNRAMDPGLVYDLTVNNYLDFLCTFGYNSSAMASFAKKPYRCPKTPITLEDMNYPSFAVPNLNGSMTVTRTVKNVGPPGTYRVRVQPPIGISVSVNPMTLKFNKVGEEQTYEVTFKSQQGSVGTGYAFGKIIWSDGRHFVRSPLAVNAVS